MSTPHRAYGKLRDIIERRGGTMTYQREGYQYGAWVISLNGKTATLKATGDQSFPDLDLLHAGAAEVAAPRRSPSDPEGHRQTAALRVWEWFPVHGLDSMQLR
jgi:hypothetical protein